MLLKKRPLPEVTMREVYLRVAYQCLVLELRRAPPGGGTTPVNWASSVAFYLAHDGFDLIARRVSAIAAAIEDGVPSHQYVAQECVEYRRGALVERRRLLPSYKASRNLTPRVTNRGGQARDVWRDPANNATLSDDLGKGD